VTGLEDLSGLNAIADELGDLPLALHLAGSYLKKYAHSPKGRAAALLAELRKPDLLKHPALTGSAATISPTRHVLHVGRTFAISYDQLKPEDATDALALKALAHAACFASGEPIPRALLIQTLKLGDDKALAAEDALLRLTGLGLLDLEANGALTIHRLVAAFVKDTSADAEAFATVLDTLLGEARRINEEGYPAPLRAWFPHLRALAEAADRQNKKQVGSLFNNLGYHLDMIGDYAGARAMYERALKIVERDFGAQHPNVATLVNNLGSVLRAIGDDAGARAMYERALKIDEAAFGPDHPDVARDVNSLGSVLKEVGDYAGARAMLERALKIVERDLGAQHPKVATLVNNLGSVLRAIGDYAGARAMLERALKIDEAAFGPDHPNVATDVNNLGGVLRALGDDAGARAMFERALKINEAAFGPDHPDVAVLANNLGLVLQDMGDYAGARAMLERALKIFERVLGPDHPHTATVQLHLYFFLPE